MNKRLAYKPPRKNIVRLSIAIAIESDCLVKPYDEQRKCLEEVSQKDQ